MRATLRASASVAAPFTRTRRSFVAPSPSRASHSAILRHVRFKALRNALSSTGPALPLARSATVSEVLVSESTERHWKLWAAASSKRPLSVVTDSSASVKRYTSMVARFGAIIPEPFPTAVSVAGPTPIERAFGSVSVVMIPRAAGHGSSASSEAIPRRPSSILSMGSLRPMTPSSSSGPAPLRCQVHGPPSEPSGGHLPALAHRSQHCSPSSSPQPPGDTRPASAPDPPQSARQGTDFS